MYKLSQLFHKVTDSSFFWFFVNPTAYLLATMQLSSDFNWNKDVVSLLIALIWILMSMFLTFVYSGRAKKLSEKDKAKKQIFAETLLSSLIIGSLLLSTIENSMLKTGLAVVIAFIAILCCSRIGGIKWSNIDNKNNYRHSKKNNKAIIRNTFHRQQKDVPLFTQEQADKSQDELNKKLTELNNKLDEINKKLGDK